nr:DNA-directed DNA polymerase [Tanacetum cinerariifolium]
MRTRSSSNLVGDSSPNPTTSNPKRCNRRRSKQPFSLEESPLDTIDDQRTMVELLRAPTKGYAEAWDRYKDLLRACPHHGFTELHQLDTFYNALNPANQDSLNFTAGGYLLERRTQDVLTIIENKSKQTSAMTTAMTAILKQFQATPPPASVKAIEEICINCGGAHPYYQFVPLSELEKIKKMNEIDIKSMQTQTNIVKNELGNEMKTSIQASMSNQTNELKNMMASFFQMNTTSTSGSRPIPSNTIGNPKHEMKAITTRSGIVLDGPFVPIPPPFINPEEDERTEETLPDQKLAEYTIKVPPPLVQKSKPSSLGNYVVHQRDPYHPPVILKKLPEKLGDPGKFLIPCSFSELKFKALADICDSINLMPLLVWKKLGLPELISTRMTLELANRVICTPAGIARDVFVPVRKYTFPADFVIVDYESDHQISLILGRPFLRTSRSLIDVHEEEMIFHDDDERLTLNMRYDTLSFSNQPHKELINMINIYNDSYEDYLEDLFATNHLSGNTTSSSPDYLLKEFADELALITFPSRNDDLPFDIESDLREIEYFHNHDPTKEMDSILEDSIDGDNLSKPNNDLVDTIPEMFTDEHTLDYSSPPLYDDVDNDLAKLESDNDDVYDDPFDSKEDKIKESKLLIDELDPPRSSDFLPSFECDSVLYEDFSEVDALPSTNNEDKVFNLGILIHENLFEVTIRVTPDKNVKKISISNASLILIFMNFLSTKKFLGSKLYSHFHPKMRKKFSTPGFSLLKEFILLFSRNYLIGALKIS